MGAIQQLLAGIGGVKNSFTFVASATSGASTITWPGGLAAGDLAILIDQSQGNTAAGASVTPSGFTLLNDTNDAGINPVNRVDVSGKKLVGSESGSLTGMGVGTGANTSVAKTLLIFRPASTISSFTLNGFNYQYTAAAPTNQNCAASAGIAPVIAIGYYLNTANSTLTTRGFSPSEDAEISNTLGANGINYVKYKIQNLAPFDETISMNDNGSANWLESFYITVT